MSAGVPTEPLGDTVSDGERNERAPRTTVGSYRPLSETLRTVSLTAILSHIPYSISLYHNLLTNTGFSTPLSPFNIKGFDYTQT